MIPKFTIFGKKKNCMKYLSFHKSFQALPIFSINDVLKAEPDFDRKQLVYWQKRGYIQKIINRWYNFSEINLSEEDLYFIANKIYSPSYISFESALAHHGLIPESVYTITSATTLKTNNFKTYTGEFKYHKLKLNLMFGYNLLSVGNRQVKIAEPSKALLDYLYINSQINSEEDLEGLRLNREVFKKLIHKKHLNEYLSFYNTKALNQTVNLLLKIMTHA